jgi:hypothetical protein
MPSFRTLSVDEATKIWPTIERILQPIFNDKNAITPLDSETTKFMVTCGACSVIVITNGSDNIEAVILYEYTSLNKNKSVTITAMAGKGLLYNVSVCWPAIVEKFRSSGVVHIDAAAEPRLARIYMRKFGFIRLHCYVRMDL